ncbi:hypothetical protein D3C87_1663470 [compost metagenome]
MFRRHRCKRRRGLVQRHRHAEFLQLVTRMADVANIAIEGELTLLLSTVSERARIAGLGLGGLLLCIRIRIRIRWRSGCCGWIDRAVAERTWNTHRQLVGGVFAGDILVAHQRLFAQALLRLFNAAGVHGRRDADAVVFAAE